MLVVVDVVAIVARLHFAVAGRSDAKRHVCSQNDYEARVLLQCMKEPHSPEEQDKLNDVDGGLSHAANWL